ncbi:ATP-binding protein [Sulfuricystis multivorans]|uniref:ATP-binding protein n=1 Tax=Sulfuricystis multivorans TaxID=2211108 RepID=UPI00155933F0|nr:ATP-binding protein [Sulfuricystis multivorans]
MNQAALESNSITSGVNESRFLEHLKTLFSTSTTVLAECLQNGRRAGASSIVFDYDVSESSLTITDNGCGIADFRALITVAESGWSQETMDSERPFGIGFFSVCFAAESVRVESKGKQIQFSSEDLIAKRKIAVEPSSFIGGTRITLHGCKLDAEKVGQALAIYAKGFAIPVFWRGEELPRPHAQANLVGKQTSVGFIHVPGIHDDSNTWFVPYGYVYCQGLPVNVSSFTPHYGKEIRPIVHVDHLRYMPRMPDRDSLIDPQQAAKDINMALKEIWREYLAAKKAEMSPADFVKTCWSKARHAECLDLMADVPVLPTEVLTYVGETPRLVEDGDGFLYQCSEQITETQVVSGAVMLFREYNEEDCGDYFARLMWAEKAKVIFVSSELPEQHWAVKHLRNLGEEEVKVSGRAVATDHFSGGWVDGDVKLMENLSVTIAGIKHPLTEAVAVGSGEWGGSRTFLVPKGITHAGYVLRQASTYTDSNDKYCETDYELDAVLFDDLVAIMSGEPAVETLKKCLYNAGVRNKTNLRNSSFRVKFDADGNMTVTAE